MDPHSNTAEYKFDRKKFFQSVIQETHWKSADPNSRPGDYFEFGTFKGDSACLFFSCIRDEYPRELPDFFHMYLFDSFEGLPETSSTKDINPQFKPGDYKCSMEVVRKNLLDHGIPENRFTLIKGYYQDILTEETLKKCGSKPAGLIYMDCDFYTSTALALNFIKPKIRNRTILYLDDMWSYAGHPGKGEYGALLDFNKDNGHSVGFTEYPIIGQNSRRVYLAYRDNTDNLL